MYDSGPFARSTEGFVSGSHPLRPLVVILTLTHLGAGNSGSLWLEEEEKIGVSVYKEERCGGNLVLSRCC